MTFEELRKELQRAGYNDNYISIGDDGKIYDIYCLKQNGEIWETYYTERGDKNQLRTFDNEADACAHFLEWLHSKPHTKQA